ncbi:pentapeptide repeat-containing protein [Leptolyngbya sp. PL-A3]|uniref:pentapeptide repeat-containing protein n=1 Tax=Leptolyngbya sp. PL-A3 TaxID=2933911 RepID=UPI00329A176C
MKHGNPQAPKWLQQIEPALAQWSVPLALAIAAFVVTTIIIPTSIDIYQSWGNIEAKERAKTGIELIQLVATVVGGIAIFWNIIIARRQLVATQEQNITDRFSKAVEQLGHDSTSVRIGGIYALLRVTQDSPRDHWTIMEILASFVRDKCGLGGEKLASNSVKYQKDVQSAISVLGHRDRTKDPIDGELYLNYNDLREVAFFDSDHSNTYFHGSDLRKSNFSGTNLKNCEFRKSTLCETNLEQANLSNANLVEANLKEAKLQGCNLQGADLQDADLTGAKGLTVEQVKAAKNWQKAIYSD